MIPLEKYKEILEQMPIVCVELLIQHDGKILLVKRKDKPAQGTWWLPGGRILKNESQEAAAQRLALREVGFDIEIVRQVGAYDEIFKEGPFDIKTGLHSVCVEYLCRPKGSVIVKLDTTSADCRWIDKVPADLHPVIKQILTDAHIF